MLISFIDQQKTKIQLSNTKKLNNHNNQQY